MKVLRTTGDLRPVITVLRQPDGGAERVREALVALGELDLELLAQMMLDTLIATVVKHPGDPQRGRVAPGGEPDAAGKNSG